jgi:hypothetical protein
MTAVACVLWSPGGTGSMPEPHRRWVAVVVRSCPHRRRGYCPGYVVLAGASGHAKAPAFREWRERYAATRYSGTGPASSGSAPPGVVARPTVRYGDPRGELAPPRNCWRRRIPSSRAPDSGADSHRRRWPSGRDPESPALSFQKAAPRRGTEWAVPHRRRQGARTVECGVKAP